MNREELSTIAETCDWVPGHPARTLQEAMQSFYFAHLINRQIEYMAYGIGARFDVLMQPFYVRDIQAGKITRDSALELLKLLWLKFEDCGRVYSPFLSGVYGGSQIVQALTIGGVDVDGNDVTNDMTYLILDAVKAVRTLQGSLNLRYHDDTPQDLVLKAIDVIRTGVCYPAFLNDKVMIPLLRKWGLPLSDARNYAIRGCVYVNIPGKNMVRRTAGYLILPKCLWWALHQGVDPQAGEQKGAPTADPNSFTCLEDVMEAYLEQVRFFFGKQVRLENFSRTIFAQYLPRPFLSALLDDCIERGQDCRKWAYPYQGEDNVIIIGPTNVADSLAAIQKFVFDDKQLTMSEYIGVLDKDWEGREDLRQTVLTQAPKYGNDDDYADAIARDVHHRTEAVLEEFESNWGLKYVGDGSGVSATYGLAVDTPATPDGRKNGEPFADATLSPAPGADTQGPSAVLQSAAKIDTLQTHQQLLNQKFLPQFLEGGNRELFCSYLKSWSDLGISHIQFNIVDKETLLEAQQHPEKHTDLIVRVAGYSAYFVDLSKGLQDHIIARTAQSFG
jgi:formate C-acetyltransferase